MKIYSLLDMKARVYGTPQFLENDEVAKRAFILMVREGETLPAKCPEDFVLVMVGEWDDEDGEIRPAEDSQVVIRGIDVGRVERVRQAGNGAGVSDEG